MICDTCKLKKICKNYDYLTEHDELTISDCSFAQSEDPYAFLKNLCKPMDITELKREPVKDPGVLFNNTEEPFKPRIVKTDEVEEAEDKIVKCPTCGEDTFESDIKECSKCHKKVCSSCSTDITNMANDGEDVVITRLCNECNGIDDSENAYNSSSSFKDLLNFDLDKKGDK